MAAVVKPIEAEGDRPVNSAEQELRAENAELRHRLEEAKETLDAIRNGAVDAFVVAEASGNRVYTLETADRPYRRFVEEMQQGAATLLADGTIVYGNRQLAELLRTPLHRLTGAPLRHFIAVEDHPTYDNLLRQGRVLSSCGEARLRWSDGTSVPVYLSFNKLTKECGADIAVLVTDLTAQKHHEQLAVAQAALSASEQRFRAFVTASSDAVYRMSADWREMHQLQGRNFIADTNEPSRTWLDKYIHPDDQERLLAAADDAIRTKSAFELEHRIIRIDGTSGWAFSRAIPLLDDQGEIVEWFGAARDITARKRHEERQRMLLNELNHRAKNTLATVQSIASQTFRGGQWAGQSRQFEERLMALSKAHDILTGEQWEGAALGTLVSDAVLPYRGEGDDRFEIRGPDVWLPPNYALALAMAFHELCTNAVKYGALSNPHGRVKIVWDVAEHGDDRELRIDWIERDGPPVMPPRQRGFGSRLIERGLKQDLNGEVRIEFAPTGVVCTIKAPLHLPGWHP